MNDEKETIFEQTMVLGEKCILDHDRDTRTAVTREYTIFQRIEGATRTNNAYLEMTEIGYNLRAYNNDGTKIIVMPKEHTEKLLRGELEKYKADHKMFEKLSSLYTRIHNKEVCLVWLSFPSNKSLAKNEARTIEVKYELALKDRSSIFQSIFKPRPITLTIHPCKHEISYTIKNPKGYRLKERSCVVKNKRIKGWKVGENISDVHYMGDSVIVMTRNKRPFELQYSFVRKGLFSSIFYVVSVVMAAVAVGWALFT